MLAIFGAAAVAQGGPPPTDVFLASLTIKGNAVILGKPLNVSNSPGYDNQPSFTPDSQSILFTSVRGAQRADPANTAASGSDIYRYDIEARTLTQLTSTPESEYSPMVAPGGRFFSVIQVEADGTQRLWRFPIGGGKPELVLSDIKPVGYHAWAGDTTLALFVLGKPPTLQIADTRTGGAEVVAQSIGRSLAPIPGGGVSFVQMESGSSPVVMSLDAATRKTSTLVRLMDGIRDPDLAWTSDGLLLVAHGGRLHGWRRGGAAFEPLADLEAAGLKGVSRMAVSPDGRWIALVAQP